MAEREPEKTDLLIFVEDPGAANGIVDLPAALQARGLKAHILATGHAVEHLQSLDKPFTTLGAETDARAILDQWTPKGVLAGTSENPETLGLALIAEARNRGLATAAFVDGPASADYRFRGPGDAPLAFAPDWILVADPVSGKNYQTLGHPPQNIIHCGHPYFDRVRAKAQELAQKDRALSLAEIIPDAPPDRPVVVFLAEISDGLEPGAFRRSPEYTLHGRGASDARTNIVLEEVLDVLNTIQPRPTIVLRLHPKNTEQEFEYYLGEIDHLSHTGPASDLLYCADLVIGMTTIALFEAALMGRPVLSVTPRELESEWLAGIGLGLIPAVHTREALRKILIPALSPPLEEQRPVMGKAPDEVINFGALERMADFMTSLLAGQEEEK